MAEFFDQMPPGSPGIGVFLNAGDPQLPELVDVVTMLDERRVDCLELAVPFPNSVTDGPVIKASAKRALAAGVDFDATLRFIDTVRPYLPHLRIALFLDWAHTVRPLSVEVAVARVARSAADALLVHATPPAVRPAYHRAAAEAGIRLVTTCYPNSSPDALDEAARHGSGYVYLVSRFGKSGQSATIDRPALAGAVTALRSAGSRCPVAIGFGVSTPADVAAFYELGADAVIVGTAFVSRLSTARASGRSVVEELAEFVDSLQAGGSNPAVSPGAAAPVVAVGATGGYPATDY
jgi:tryptophan synthase alpha chain